MTPPARMAAAAGERAYVGAAALLQLPYWGCPKGGATVAGALRAGVGGHWPASWARKTRRGKAGQANRQRPEVAQQKAVMTAQTRPPQGLKGGALPFNQHPAKSGPDGRAGGRAGGRPGSSGGSSWGERGAPVRRPLFQQHQRVCSQRLGRRLAQRPGA
jgi:hypothetical protein